ncbi:MAG: hypothetical protein Q8P86_01780, partial [bacterium]|nr:hypothetical protein [bacterium]
MQSEIIFDNKKFLSSREAARLVKYTSDYVGQLCRQAKVEGRRVGRVGYVSESSILAHKNENDSHEKHHSVGKIFAGTHDAEVRGESIPDESGGLKNASGIREGAGGEGGESRQKDEFAQEIFSAKHDDAKYHTNVLSGESHKPLVFKDISDAISDTRDNARNNDRVEDEKSRVYKYSKDERPLLPVIGKQTNPAVWGVIPPTFEFKKFSGKFSDAKKAPISRSGNFVYRDLFKKTSAFAMAVVLIVIPFVAGNYLKEKTEYILAVVKNGADRASSFYDFSFVATERIVKETYVFASRVPLYFETGLMTSAVYSLDKYDELSESVSEIYDNPKLAFEKTGRVALLTTWTISKNASSSYLRFVSSASESVVSSFENAYRGIYNARHSFLNQAKTMARSSLSSTASSATGGLRGFFGTVRDFVAGLFGGQQKESEEEEKIFASESPSENEQAKKDADDKVKVATNSKNQTTSSSVTVVEKPQTIIRQVTENVTYSGITVDKFNSVIKEIEDRLATISIDISKAQTSTSGNATYINNVYNTVGTMGRIEHLKDLDLETPTIRGATITGSTGTFTGNISVGGALTVTGTATSTLVAGIDIEGGCFAIDGTCISGSGGSGSGTVNSGTSGRLAYYAGTGTEVSETSANLFWDNTNGLLGLGTTTPGQKLSVAGDILGNNIIGSYFTATSSTATSTFAGGFTINTSGFVYDWSSGFVGIATTTPGSLLSVGDTSGINFTTATSTWNSTGGINLASGCFAINGTCISGSGGGGDISSVSNSDGTLTIDPTTGDVVASLNLTNANTWSALQIFSQASTTRLSVFDTAYFGATATSTFNSAGVLTLASALAETSGGTGQSSYTEGDILYSDSSNSLSKLGIGTGGFVLGVSNGVPAWVATTTLSTISGTLSVAKGGTGLTTFGGTNTLLYTSSADTLTSNSNFVFDGTNLGVGTTTPYAKLSVVGPVVAEYFHATSTIATSTFAGGLSVGNGGLNYDWYSGITSVDSLELGALSFPENSGKVSWI